VKRCTQCGTFSHITVKIHQLICCNPCVCFCSSHVAPMLLLIKIKAAKTAMNLKVNPNVHQILFLCQFAGYLFIRLQLLRLNKNSDIKARQWYIQSQHLSSCLFIENCLHITILTVLLFAICRSSRYR